MSYYLARSLSKLREQVNERWPKRDKASDGWIGDAAHNARKSDHNPDYADGGVVRALDIDKDGINVDELLKVVVGADWVAYVIWNRRIWTHAKGWQPYTGTNGHTAHVHISIRHTKAAENATPKALGGAVKPVGTVKPTTPAKPAVKPAEGKQWPYKALPLTSAHTNDSHNAWVQLMSDIGYKDKGLGTALQKWLKKAGYYRGLIDGDFGSMSVKALQRFLKDKGFYKGVIDGKRQGMTIKAEIAYLNSQMKFY